MAEIFETFYSANQDRYSQIMEYNRCGNSGVLLPKISLGLWHNFGSVDSYENSRQMAHYAFDNGITHFDLANNYGPICGSAERTFGKLIKNSFVNYRDELFISSKAGHDMWSGPYGSWGSRKHLISSLNQSLKRMNLDYVDLFYSHRLDPLTPLEETLQTLVDIVKSGKALYVGISKYPAKEAEIAYKYLRDRDVPCLCYQGKYNMLYRDPEESIIPSIINNRVGYVAFTPLAQGLLTDRYLKGIPKDSRIGRGGALTQDQLTENILQMLKELNNIASNRDQTLAQMALAWVLQNDFVTSVIIGASSVSQIEDNLKSLKNIKFDATELKSIENILNSIK